MMMTDMNERTVVLVVSAHNQEATLDEAFRRLHGAARGSLASGWSMVIVDHASTDGTLPVAQRLATSLSNVSVLHLPQRLDRKALRSLWNSDPAEVVAFVEVGPESDVDQLLTPLVRRFGAALDTEPSAATPLQREIAEHVDRRFGRRTALLGLGAAGLTGLLAACGSSSSKASTTSTIAPSSTTASKASTGATTDTTGTTAATNATASTSAASTATVGSVATADVQLAAEMTEGPYYLDLNLVRDDIREDRQGVPLALKIVVVDTATGAALPGASVDIWHCDANGLYSGFVSTSASSNGGGGGGGGGGFGGPPGGGAPDGGPPGGGAPDGGLPGGVASSNSNATTTTTADDDGTFLRGTQVSGTDGAVTFTTIYPGWYTGRAVHIHMKVNVGGTTIHTGQLFFDDTFTDTVYAKSAPYSSRGARDVRNANDNIFSGGGAATTLDVTSSGDGYAAGIAIGVKQA